MIIETNSPEETFALGQKLGEQAKAGQIYTLNGDLGVGKTVFTQGIARGLGITEAVSSPTFTIVQVYEEGRLPFYHFDVYRIGDIEEMEEIGYDDYFFGNGVCMIEWAELIEELIPENSIHVTIEKDLERGFDYRRITITGRMGKRMKILALDSSGLVASVAVVEEDQLLAEYTVNYKKTHSQTLLPMLDEIAKMIELDLETIDAIAVAAGPGSFTGLRIGSATAKGLGLALKKPLIPVPTVDALAYNLYDTTGVICPMMDARRKQVYTGIYRFEDHELVTVSAQKAIAVEELIQELNALGEAVTFLGDGVTVYQEMLKENMQVPYSFAPAHLNKQRAGAVGALAEKYYREGKTVTAAEHQPEYLRISQAERERAEREAGKR